MTKLKDEKSTITISRSPAYDKHKLRTEGLDIDRVIKFNKFEKIEVTKEELDNWGFPKLPRWVIVHADDVDWVNWEEAIKGEENVS